MRGGWRDKSRTGHNSLQKGGGKGMKEMGEKVDHRPENKAVMESG